MEYFSSDFNMINPLLCGNRYFHMATVPSLPLSSQSLFTNKFYSKWYDIYALPCVKQISSGNMLWSAGSSTQCSVVTQMGGMGSGGREVLEGEDYVYIQLIHFVVQQKLTQFCKATITPLKKNGMKLFHGRRMYNPWVCERCSMKGKKKMLIQI